MWTLQQALLPECSALTRRFSRPSFNRDFWKSIHIFQYIQSFVDTLSSRKRAGWETLLRAIKKNQKEISYLLSGLFGTRACFEYRHPKAVNLENISGNFRRFVTKTRGREQMFFFNALNAFEKTFTCFLCFVSSSTITANISKTFVRREFHLQSARNTREVTCH